ncbi:lipid-A-disaccharide synthase N-terminal domain-containing protein [Amorphus coralli]|uniref:lipid-A-disaccharide synthase N-terminal domain-containing protein n=1 Tax=Amorphus coralli TaxID=340680 RepID=UPI000368E7E3|nr:lipid-A-disaccharide synthase N-terminal domain-containing protein [Amorphus coralli]
MGSEGFFAGVWDWLHHVFVAQWDLWLILGFGAQFMFSMRFLVQWIASEKARRSVVPVAFWFFSLGGGALLLAYAIHKQDPVFIAGQAAGLVIYVRNLWLIMREHRAALVKTD